MWKCKCTYNYVLNDVEDDNIHVACVITGYLMQSDVCLATSAAKVLSTRLWVAFPLTYSIGEQSSCLYHAHLVLLPFPEEYISAI